MSDRAYIAALVAIAGLVVALLWLGQRPAPQAPDTPDVDGAEDRRAAHTTGPATLGAPTTPASPSGELSPEPPHPPIPPAPRAGGVPTPNRSADPGDVGPLARVTSADARASADAGSGDTTDAGPQWVDPVNARVLGPQSWMAPDDDAEAARIDEVFERYRAVREDPRLGDRARASSIASAREIVDACFATLRERQPAARGRLIVAWRAEPRAGRGFIVAPRVTANVGLRDPAFESCLLEGLTERPFGPADGEPVEVEAPFFYDGSF